MRPGKIPRQSAVAISAQTPRSATRRVWHLLPEPGGRGLLQPGLCGTHRIAARALSHSIRNLAGTRRGPRIGTLAAGDQFAFRAGHHAGTLGTQGAGEREYGRAALLS